MDWATALVLWTPISIALLAAFLAALFLAAVLVWVNRDALAGWLQARLAESSTKHGITVALTATTGWVATVTGVMPVEAPVPFKFVLGAWAVALILIVKADPAAFPSSAGPAA